MGRMEVLAEKNLPMKKGRVAATAAAVAVTVEKRTRKRKQMEAAVKRAAAVTIGW